MVKDTRAETAAELRERAADSTDHVSRDPFRG